MKKIILISSFCDTQKKMDVLKENLKIIKNLGLEVMVLSPNFITLDQETRLLADFVFYTKENPLLSWPIRQFTHWREYPLMDSRILTLHRGVKDYGWAALYQTKKLFQIALTFDYDVFYHLIYDVKIDEVLINELLGNEINFVHPRRNPSNHDDIWETTLHFMVFDRIMTEKIEREITLNEYLSTNGVAEGEVLKWTKKFPIRILEHCVEDRIFYWENFDFFDYSPFSEFKMFISKNPENDIWLGYENHYTEKLTPNLRLVFYNCPIFFQIKTKIDGIIYDLEPKNLELIELPIDSQIIRKISFEYKGEEKDFTENFSDIMFNQIFYNFRSPV